VFSTSRGTRTTFGQHADDFTKVEHTIRTIYGGSMRSYGGSTWTIPTAGLAWGDTEEGPMSGMGQGNGAAPASWAVISTPMLEIMKKNGHCTVFMAFISGNKLKIVGLRLWMTRIYCELAGQANAHILK
jgi:hypothetical protein